MKIKVNEASGAVLNWMVATCEGYTHLRVSPHSGELLMAPPRASYGPVELADLNYSYDWALGGPIIERKAHNLFKHNGGTDWCCACNVPRGGYTAIVTADGPTPLIAAMRCYVASKLGDEVDVPDVLINQSTED